jgi:hypothetical protein
MITLLGVGTAVFEWNDHQEGKHRAHKRRGTRGKKI